MRDQLSAAAAFAAAADRAQSDLVDAYACPPAYRPDRGEIAGLHQKINYNLKRAEVGALLAIAQRLDDLAVSR